MTSTKKQERADKRAAALRENLMKRKAQKKERASETANNKTESNNAS